MPVIRAFYDDMSDAGKAVKELNKLGYKAYLDMRESFSAEYSSDLDGLLGYNPIGGYSSGADERDFNASLLVNVDKDRLEEAKKHIWKQGGTII